MSFIISLLHFLKNTFKDKLQNPSGRELTVFVFVIITIIAWIAQQFFAKDIPEWMFLSFISIIAAGIGLYTFEKP
jgi:hypothetical protein